MFVYLIIAIELTVLYVVFWIVFLREPHPREIRADLWGSYFQPTDRQANDIAEAQSNHPLISNKQLDFYLPQPVSSKRLYRTRKLRKIRRKKILMRRSRRAYLYCQICSGSGHTQYAHRETTLAQLDTRPMVEKFLLSLNRVLNRLSVKVP